jgi:uncharacterized protein
VTAVRRRGEPGLGHDADRGLGDDVGWDLVVDGRAVAPAEVARSPAGRGWGLLGRGGLGGALWLEPCRCVHTLGMRFALDVAYVDVRGRVLLVRRLRPARLGPVRARARVVVEAAAGAFDTWGVVPGATLTLRPAAEPRRRTRR